ncbi:hypothetical protein DV36_47885 [Amycolatopsis mediterranei]|nr:hypothetical protein DV36_47885 [Amycolatopsis mediterranei]
MQLEAHDNVVRLIPLQRAATDEVTARSVRTQLWVRARRFGPVRREHQQERGDGHRFSRQAKLTHVGEIELMCTAHEFSSWKPSAKTL